MSSLVALSLLAATVTAPLTPASVRRVARAHGDQIQECYDTWTATLADKPVRTKLLVALKVRKSGRPEAITPEEFAGTPFGDCVVARVRRWRFPRHTSKGAAAAAHLSFELIPPLQMVMPRAPRQALPKLSPEAIRWVVASHQAEVQTCFEAWLEGLERSPGEVKMRVSLEILSDGRPSDVKPDVLKGTPLAACVTDRVRRWRFPSHEGPEPIAVVVPLRLVPRRAGAQRGTDATSRPPSQEQTREKPQALQPQALQQPALRPPRGVPPLGPQPPAQPPPPSSSRP